MSDPAYLSGKDPESTWKSICENLKEHLPPQSFLTWFKPLVPISLKGGILNLRVPSRFYYDWIESHYSTHLRNSVFEILGERVEVRYTVETSDDGAEDETGKPRSELVQLKEITPEEEFTTNLNPQYRFSNFVEGDCNRFARAAAITLAESPGQTPFNPLMIFGGSGKGKTHLIQAIGNFIVENRIARRVLYVTSEKFTTDFIQAIRSGGTEGFSALYRSVDVLLLDDVHFFMAKDKTQEEFFHTFNTLHQAGKQLIFSTDRTPRDLGGFDERIVSRLQWGLVTELRTPEFETRLAILKSLSDDNRIELPDDVAQFIALNITDNVRTLQGVLNHVLAQASLLRKPITIELARKVMDNFTKLPARRISIDRIQEIVSDEFGVASDTLRSKTRRREISEPRQIAMYLCTEFSNLTLKAIGLHFGGRDHATVIHARKSICERLEKNGSFAEIIEKLKKKIELVSI